MKQHLFLLLTTLLLPLLTHSQAIQTTPTFETEAQQQQYMRMIRTIRCPTCQNNDIAESNAPLAKQLRTLIAEQIKAGKNEKAITEYLTSRYGDFITYHPPVKKNTLILWYAPISIMAICLLIWLILRRLYRPSTSSLTTEQRAELQQWLNQYRK